jgi:hypothetical protein
VVELFVQREDAEGALAEVLADEPTWAGELAVVSVDLASVTQASIGLQLQRATSYFEKLAAILRNL